ncbi:MAG: patatin-like phospholipase family protein [Thermoanaerobaculia bacterium]
MRERQAPRRRSRPKVGLALAGGGPEGAIYEIGALRALDEAIEGIDLNDLDLYIGVSAGAFIAANLVNHLTPTQMCRAILKHEPGEHPFRPEIFFTPALAEFGGRARSVPHLIADSILEFAKNPSDRTLIESFTRMARALPVGIFANEPIRHYLERIYSMKGRSDDFRQLEHQLIVVAAELNSGRSVLFGLDGQDHVPVSRAVQASTALPGLYPPVMIDGHYYVDGVLNRTLHASVALSRGVQLLLCINPIVPVDMARAVESGEMPEDQLVRRGLPTVLSQTFRTLIHSRLAVGMKAYDERYPDADVVLIEPERSDYRMFFTNIFSFSARRDVAQHAYRATRRELARRADELAPVLARHGVRLRRDVLADPERDLWAGVGVGGPAPRRAQGEPVTERLERLLDRLESLSR